MSVDRPRGGLRAALCAVLLVAGVLVCGAPQAATPAAGSVIRNQAEASFRVGDSVPLTVTSNAVDTVVTSSRHRVPWCCCRIR
jgi:uncharacterized protein YjeT (DUF2065 family)